MELSERVLAVLTTIPAKPGCYLMKNAAAGIIYVGKAVNLRNRVRSYFHSDAGHDAKTRRLVRDVADIEWILVGSELEALILEMNLIKKHRPKYNVRLKDDKRYPYIKVHWAEAFPKVTVTRQMADDGSRYFGPYTSAWAVYQTLDALRRIFPYLTCDRVITGQDQRACLYHDIKLCTAPCIGAINHAGYRQMISDLMDFLAGHSEHIITRLEAGMQRAADEMRFEKAAALRDQLQAIQSIVERQKIVFASDYLDSDVLAMARSDGEACVQVFFIRGGKLIGREYFVLEGTEDTASSEVMTQFVKQFYTEAATIPRQVMLPEEIEEARIIGQWLRSRRGAEAVEFIVPKEGQPQQLIQMAAENATETLAASRHSGRRMLTNRSRHSLNCSLHSGWPSLQIASSATMYPISREPPSWALWSSSSAAFPANGCIDGSTSRASSAPRMTSPPCRRCSHVASAAGTHPPRRSRNLVPSRIPRSRSCPIS